MFEMVLGFLADPMFFAGFSVVIGVAYVVVWVVSLKEIVQPSPESLFQPVRRNPEFDIQEHRFKPTATKKRNDRVRVRRKDMQNRNGSRRGRTARAA